MTPKKSPTNKRVTPKKKAAPVPKPAPKIGAPTKLTPEVKTAITTALESGATYEIAAAFGGITYMTLNNWVNRGRAASDDHEELLNAWDEMTEAQQKKNPMPVIAPQDQPFVDFFYAIRESTSVAAVGWLRVIDQAAQTDARWAAWMLGQRYPADYGEKGRGGSATVEVKNGDATASTIIKIVYGDATPATLIEEEGNNGRGYSSNDAAPSAAS